MSLRSVLYLCWVPTTKRIALTSLEHRKKFRSNRYFVLELSSFTIPRAKHFVKNHACPFFHLNSQVYPQKKRIFILVQIKLVSDIFDTTWRCCEGKRIFARAYFGVAERTSLKNLHFFLLDGMESSCLHCSNRINNSRSTANSKLQKQRFPRFQNSKMAYIFPGFGDFYAL